MVEKKLYVGALLITSIIFILGIYVGSHLSTINQKSFEDQLEKSLLEFQSIEFETRLLEQMSNKSLCEYAKKRIPELVKSKIELANKFSSVSEEETKKIQKQYVIALVRYWLYYTIEQEHCGIKTPTVLFFFSPEQYDSKRQGEVLDYIVYRSENNLSVFSFNYELDEPLIDLISEMYNINNTPSIVIEKVKYEGLQNLSSVEKKVCGEYNLSFC